MGRKMTKNQSWIQFSDEVWGEAVNSDSDRNNWLRSLDDPAPSTDTLDPLPDVNDPLLPTWMAEYQLSRLVGPHEQTWKYRWGIEKEISRMSSACRESVGTERESNLRQLRDAEAARSEFCETPEFRAAVAYALAVVDRVIEAAGNDLIPAQVATKARYAEIRASLEAVMAAPVRKSESITKEVPQEPSNQLAATDNRPTRKDAMALELEEIICEMKKSGTRLTAASVMSLLKRSAGKGGCVVDVAGDGDGVVWERSNGKSETMKMKALEVRLSRMQKSVR